MRATSEILRVRTGMRRVSTCILGENADLSLSSRSTSALWLQTESHWTIENLGPILIPRSPQLPSRNSLDQSDAANHLILTGVLLHDAEGWELALQEIQLLFDEVEILLRTQILSLEAGVQLRTETGLLVLETEALDRVVEELVFATW